MRIISKFKDYYDSAMGFGIDNTCVYVRHTEEIPVTFNEPISEVGSDISTAVKRTFGLCSDSLYLTSFKPVYVGFCGKIYMGVSYTALKDTPRKPTRDRHYSTDEVVTSYAWSAADLDDETLDDPLSDRYRFSKDKTLRDWFTSAETASINQDHIELFTKHTIVCFMKEGTGIAINPRLTDVAFQRKLDSYTAFQELSMFISGTLAQPNANMVKIEDRYVIASKGFDKRSFRKEPSKHRR